MPINYIWPETNINITHLPLSDPLCANDTCLAFAIAGEASQTLISWSSQFMYGHYVCFFWGIILGLFSLVYFTRRLHYFHTSRSSIYLVEDRPTAGQKCIAMGRYIAYRRVSGRLANYKRLPALGPALLVAFSCLFATLVCFVQHPYYRQNSGYGSPPLGIRAGLAGVAMTPITLALSGKYNFITLLTGFSHEKLNFLHRWCGYIYLFFGIVHTVPFLISDYNSGGSNRLYYEFYHPGSYEYTGIAPFAVLVFLCAFSNPWFHSRCYELFVHSHVAAAIAYLGLMFWHAGDSGDSWVYLWVTVAIWVVQLLARAWGKTATFEFRQERRDGIAQLTVLDDELGQAAMLRISVNLPLHWTPGQHVFLRFPKLSVLENHPFTMASIPKTSDSADDAKCRVNELVFMVRPYNGITKRLLQHAKRHDTARNEEHSATALGPHLQVQATDSLQVKIDGPYGGLEEHRAMHKLYDHMILVAGGGGISAMLPWVISLSRQIAEVEEPCRVQKVNLIWCIRHATAKAWVDEELQKSLRRAGPRLEIDIHVTDGNCGEALDNTSAPDPLMSSNEQREDLDVHFKSKGEETSGSPDGAPPIHLHAGRRYLLSVLSSLVSLRRTMIMGCGPESLKIDLSNTAASLQMLVLHDKVDEVALHTETFGW